MLRQKRLQGSRVFEQGKQTEYNSEGMLLRGAFFLCEVTENTVTFFSRPLIRQVADHLCLFPTIVRRSAMFVKTLKSLVLRDVSVRRDGAVADARLGFGYLAASQPREVPFFSMRHGGGEIVVEPQGSWSRGHSVSPVENPAALRAGRSVRLAGVLTRRTPTTPVVDGTPRLAWWFRQAGGAIPTAATSTGRSQTPSPAVAPVGKTLALTSVPAPRTGNLADRLCPTTSGQSCLSFQRSSWTKQAGRTPPASTRGRLS